MSKRKRLSKTLGASVDYFFQAAGVVAIIISFATLFIEIRGEISFTTILGCGVLYGVVGCTRKYKEIVLKEEQEKLQAAEAQETQKKEKAKLQLFIDMGKQVRETLAAMESKTTPASSRIEEEEEFKPAHPLERKPSSTGSSKRKLAITVGGPGASPSLGVQFRLPKATITVATQHMRSLIDEKDDLSPSQSDAVHTGRQLGYLGATSSTGSIHPTAIHVSTPVPASSPTLPTQLQHSGRSGSEVPLTESVSSDNLHHNYGLKP